jgi:hypothetical protein
MLKSHRYTKENEEITGSQVEWMDRKGHTPVILVPGMLTQSYDYLHLALRIEI